MSGMSPLVVSEFSQTRTGIFPDNQRNGILKIKILDLFCGGGGATSGYRLAFPRAHIVGVDMNPAHSRQYCGDNFIACDAIEFLRTNGKDFDFIHASPPCQSYSAHVSSSNSKWVNYSKGKDEPRLIDSVRALIQSSDKPGIIENVMGARDSMQNPVCLCGSMFGLPISRHRLFESIGWSIRQPEHPKCRGIAKQYAALMGWEYRDMTVCGKGRRAGCAERWAHILGVAHPMTQAELAESIPPAYTAYVGHELASQWG